jgi:hypothetical protein
MIFHFGYVMLFLSARAYKEIYGVNLCCQDIFLLDFYDNKIYIQENFLFIK